MPTIEERRAAFREANRRMNESGKPVSDPHLFTILWYAGGPDHAPNRVIGRDVIKRHDLTDAIKRACSLMTNGGGADDGHAHGFYVRKHDPRRDPEAVTTR